MDLAVCSSGCSLPSRQRCRLDLERELDWQSRMSTLEGYRGLLARWWGYYAVFEPMVAASPSLAGLGPRPKLHILEGDLAHLGMTETEIAELPHIEPPRSSPTARG